MYSKRYLISSSFFGLLILFLASFTALGVMLAGATSFGAAGRQSDLVLFDKYNAVEFQMAKARTAFAKGNVKNCEKELDRCLTAVEDHYEAHYLKSQLRYREADYSRALTHMISAENGYLRFMTAVDAARKAKFNKDLDESLALAELIPELKEAYDQFSCMGSVNLAAQMTAEQKLNVTKQDQSEKLRANPGGIPAEYLYFHGNCLFRLKRYPEAEAEYRAALEADDTHRNAYNNLINLLYTQKRFREAGEVLAQAESYKVEIQAGLRKAVLDAAGK
jgi:tetratricopeptide (TPR) repeat protein